VKRMNRLINCRATPEEYENISKEVFCRSYMDDTTYEEIGRDLIDVYKKNPDVVNDVMIALCGWSLESLAVFAGVLEDEEGLIA